MSREYLGLFDTPASRADDRLALGIVGALSVVLFGVLPLSGARVGEVPAFVPTVCAMMLVGELILASLLYSQAAVFGARALTVLASGYAFTALLLIPYALTFPGAFARDGWLHAGLNTTSWLMVFRRWAEPLFVIAYVVLKPSDTTAAPARKQAPPAAWCLSAVAGTAILLTLLATLGHDLLPPMFVSRSEVVYSNLLAFNISMILLLCVALGLLLWRRTSILDNWLLVSLAAALAQGILNLPLHARFTFGWYALMILMIISHLVVLLAVIAESNRLYVRLARSTAAWRRERDIRLLTIDTVAAAMLHEVGQPLTALSLSAGAAFKSLSGPRPNIDRAINSIRDTLDASERALAVAKSVRATFSRRAESLSEFQVNDLVLESVALLEREAAAAKVALRWTLSDGLPPVRANRVQIQQVIINLLVNAIEAVSETRPGIRRAVHVRSVQSDGDTVCVEIGDSGPGIQTGALERIFEPFFTTKGAGPGLGLPLSREIVEAHGGQLHVGESDFGGALFRVELPVGVAGAYHAPHTAA